MGIFRRHMLSILTIGEVSHTFAVISENSYTGKVFYCVAEFDGNAVSAEWSLTSGSQYATINSNGKVDINPGVVSETITILCEYTYDGVVYSDLRTITISYDNQLTIEGSSAMEGTNGNVVARYNGVVVGPVWSITSGGAYASIDQTGAITIMASGEITVSATYSGYTATKTIALTYANGTESTTEVEDDGSVITTTTTTVENPDGSTTTTSTSTTTNKDGSFSNTETETTTNTDGSSTTTSTTTNSDGSTSTISSTTSAPDPDEGFVTTETTTTQTNADGSSSETTETLVENQDGSSQLSSTTVDYDENGDALGSTTNEITNNADGSSESTTTNYNADGDPTSTINNEIDVDGNSSTQDVVYDEEGNEIVTGYTIDTSDNPDGNKNFNADGVNTEFYAFDVTHGFVLDFNFIINFLDQPANQNQNHHNILTMKRADPEPWYGFQLRQSGTNKYIQLGTQFSTGGNTNTTISPIGMVNDTAEYNIRITYDPTKNTNTFVCRNMINDTNVYTSNLLFPDIPELHYLSVLIGYSVDANGNPYRYSNIDVLNFSITRISNVATPVIVCSGDTVTISCETSGATIYYRLNETGRYQTYTEPITISADTVVQAYASLDNENSCTVTETCLYDNGIDRPTISCDGEFVTITCDTPNVDIYYRLGTSGAYSLYTSTFSISADTTVQAFADLNGDHSPIATMDCTYNPFIMYAPDITCDGTYVTITCDTVGVTIYYKTDQDNTYSEYVQPFEIFADTVVQAYATLSGHTSSVTTETCIYAPVHDYSQDYLTLRVLTPGTIKWNSIGSGMTKAIDYSLNDGAWVSITASSSTTINVVADDVVRLRGTNSTYAKDKSNYSGFQGGTATFNAEGNIMSLVYGDNFVNQTTLTATYTFCSMFKLSNVISAEHLILPATALTTYCYRALFSNANSLIAPPALPAGSLSQGCYYYMFENCAFQTAPDLLAGTLAKESYFNMFNGCSNLNYIKCLATSMSAQNCLNNWVVNVASQGTFVQADGVSWSRGASGIPTNWTAITAS